ncbi:MAG: SUF system NifU family Fe-S cluster assembly protein [Anaerolineaceae bacterium]|nr:SUF system NifU family Fe-S cluster assembly protein [Anaerolineaceae bacterium]
MDDFYREEILEHYTNPHHYGRLEDPDISHEEENPLCGDRVRFDLELADDGKTVEDVRFSAVGCAISKASASMLSDLLIGKTLDEIRELTKEDVIEELGIELGPVRLKCALLPLKVVKVGAYGLEGWQGESEPEDEWATA